MCLVTGDGRVAPKCLQKGGLRELKRRDTHNRLHRGTPEGIGNRIKHGASKLGIVLDGIELEPWWTVSLERQTK